MQSCLQPNTEVSELVVHAEVYRQDQDVYVLQIPNQKELTVFKGLNCNLENTKAL